MFKLCKSTVLIEGSKMLTTYGIELFDKSGSILDEFRDVSFNRNLTERIVTLLNESNVEQCHFFDIILDELNR